MQDSFGKKEKKENGRFIKKYYSIKSEQNNKVIDMRKDKDDKHRALIWNADNGMSQAFTFIRHNYSFLIKDKNIGLYWTVDGNENGAYIYGAEKKPDHKGQLFKVEKKENGNVVFIRTPNDKVVEIANDGQGKGTHIVQWKFNGNENQQFTLVDPRALDSSTDEGETLETAKEIQEKAKKAHKE